MSRPSVPCRRGKREMGRGRAGRRRCQSAVWTESPSRCQGNLGAVAYNESPWAPAGIPGSRSCGPLSVGGGSRRSAGRGS